MSFERPIYSFSYPTGEPPTPSITPKSATFGKNPFGTPRLESNFYDPRFSPTDTLAASPEFLKTPRNLSFSTPVQSPVLHRGTKRAFSGHDIETELSSHVHHLSPNPSLPLPPVEPSRQLTSSPNPSASSANQTETLASTGNTTPLETVTEMELGSSMRSASSIQTPPPTSTSVSKKKAQQAQVAKLAKESAGNGRRKSTHIFPKPQTMVPTEPTIQPSPQPFSNIQFSPEAFGGFSMAGGPATAPVYPQNKLFWDPTQNADGLNLDFSTDDAFSDAFGIGLSKPVGSFMSTDDPMTMSQITSTSFDVDNIMGLSMPSGTTPPSQTNFLSSAGLISGSQSKLGTTAVNPSLLFSSPSRAPEPAKVEAALQINQSEVMRPYAHQMMDAQRERESSQHRKSKRRRGPEADSPAVKAALEALRDEDKERMSVQRTFMDSINAQPTNEVRRTKKVGFEGTKNEKSSSLHRRESHKRRPETNRKASNRTSVELTIGPDGRAKTQTKVVAQEPADSLMGIDSDSGNTECLSSEDEAKMMISQPSSFAYPSQLTNKPKASRFNPASNAHSQKSSYASTMMSNTSDSTLPRSGKSRRRVASGLALDLNEATRSQRPILDPALTTTFISNPLGDSQGTESETETVIESDDDRGDAQSELKKIVRDRAQRKASSQIPAPDAYDSRLSFSNDPSHVPYPRLQNLTTPTQDMLNNISPTTITDPDLATPSTGRDSQSGNSTRCVCHDTESDGEFMILCDSCRKWLHVRCTGINPQKLPKVYLCVFCTGQTPNVRGGRVREPARAVFPPPSSPLAHKTHRFR